MPSQILMFDIFKRPYFVKKSFNINKRFICLESFHIFLVIKQHSETGSPEFYVY